MKREDINVCIMRVAGTNCDSETRRAFQSSGMKAKIKRFNHLVKSKQDLFDYHALVIPGGFSHGDYVRAGAIWAKQLMAKLGNEIAQFIEEERPILGICNGFQILVEAGLLPRFAGTSPLPEAALAPNSPPGYNCRWIHVKHEGKGNCVFTRNIPSGSIMRIPIAHSEGRFIFSTNLQHEYLNKLLEKDQLVLRYCKSNGELALGEYPSNPNGSFSDIAGVCNPSGTIFGLMPHPERAYFSWNLPDWTRNTVPSGFGDGRLIFDSVAEHLTKRF